VELLDAREYASEDEAAHNPSPFIEVCGICCSFGSEPRVRGSAGRIMIRPGQAIMIAWLTTAHAPLWEPAHERAPLQERSLQLRKIYKCERDGSMRDVPRPTRRR